MPVKTGPCRPFVSVMYHMYHCHLNAPLRQWPARRRWMRWGDEMGIKVILGCTWWKRSPDVGPRGKRFQHACDIRTRQKNDSLRGRTGNIGCRVCRLYLHPRISNYTQVSVLAHTQTHAQMQERTWTPPEPMSHVFLFWNVRRQHWSSSVLCLSPIAVRLTRAHTRDCLITCSFSMCPSIIRLMQSFMWPC